MNVLSGLGTDPSPLCCFWVLPPSATVRGRQGKWSSCTGSSLCSLGSSVGGGVEPAQLLHMLVTGHCCQLQGQREKMKDGAEWGRRTDVRVSLHLTDTIYPGANSQNSFPSQDMLGKQWSHLQEPTGLGGGLHQTNFLKREKRKNQHLSSINPLFKKVSKKRVTVFSTLLPALVQTTSNRMHASS